MHELDEMLASDEVSTMPSGEMVAPVITCLMLDRPGWFPLNIPNEGQVADLPDGVTVESMCVADGKGVHGRDEVHLPAAMAECVHRVSAAQECTVEAAVTRRAATRCSRRCSSTRWRGGSTSTASGR